MKLYCLFFMLYLSLITPIFADGLGINLGPFSLEFGAGNYENDSYSVQRKPLLDNLICHAISEQKRIEVIVRNKDIINSTERKLVVRKLLIEPYAFGINQNNEPILKGVIVDRKLIKEVTIKYGENEESYEDRGQRNSFFSGLFKSHNNLDTINLDKVYNIKVIDDSHFEVSNNFYNVFKESENNLVKIICHVSIPNKE